MVSQFHCSIYNLGLEFQCKKQFQVAAVVSDKSVEMVEALYNMNRVSDALLHLRPHNTYLRNSLPPRMNPKASFDVHGGLPSSMDGSLVLRAHAMVDAAFQALSSTKESEDASTRIRQCRF
ncbi:ALWAYS EARLY 2 protein [Spatholobus suberectus]|nr:ALWAYS EARLY 2 protein [Spatholobus suberectus]